GPNVEHWVSLEQLFTEVLNEFTVVINSGLLTVVRRWDSSMQITGSPALRQLLVLFVSKLLGRNTRPLTVTMTSRMKEGFCDLELRWQCTDSSQNQVADAGTVFARDLKSVHEIAYQVGGERGLTEGQPQITLTLPAAPQTAPGRAGIVR